MKNEDRVFKNPLYEYINDSIWKHNKNVLIVITGSVGAGKSYVGLKIASEIDPTFTHETMKDRIFVEPEDFLKRIVDRENKLEKGQVLLMDECGVSANSRTFMSRTNLALSYISQTVRRRNLVIIMCLPSFSMLDSQIRSLFHIYIEAKKIDFDNNVTKCKVYKLFTNKMKSADPWKKCFRYKNNSGRMVRAYTIGFKKVNAKLWHEYERIADILKDKIELKALNMVTKQEVKRAKEEPFDPKATAIKVVADNDRYGKHWRGKETFDLGKIQLDFKIGGKKARQVVIAAEDILVNNASREDVKVSEVHEMFT